MNNFPAWLEGPYSKFDSQFFGGMQTERIPIEEACSRVAGETIETKIELPRMSYSEVRGFALRGAKYGGASVQSPISVQAGDALPHSALFAAAGGGLEGRQALYVPNGMPLPPGTTAVIPFPLYDEEFEKEGSLAQKPSLTAMPPSQLNMFGKGKDYRSGEVLVKKGQRITAQTQAILAAAGFNQIMVSKRPRIGVVVSSYDQVAPGVLRELWQRPDSSGLYIRSLLRQWGYDVPAVEYIEAYDIHRRETKAEEAAFERRLEELETQYDLIIGAGLPNDQMFDGYGLHRSLRETTRLAARVQWAQTLANCFYFSRGQDRSPVQTKTFPILREDGTTRGENSFQYFDRAMLIGLCGFTSEVAMLVHVIVRHLLDAMEYVVEAGPYWETGTLAQDIARDVELNRMLWATLSCGAEGETLVHPFDSWHQDELKGFAQAEAIVAIPAGATLLPGGSTVQFLRLDRTTPPVGTPRPVPVPPPATWPPPQAKTEAPAPASVATKPASSVPQCWARLDEWLQADPARLPGGFNPPATEAEIAALQEGLGVTLPGDFVASLRIHNGQPDEMSNFFEGESLLGAKSILARWTIWRKLVEDGAFEEASGAPDAGIREDWYHLRWIPFTSNGCGDHLCLDLAPAEGGTVGQVIRVWHDEAERRLEATSFAEWLDRIVAMKTA